MYLPDHNCSLVAGVAECSKQLGTNDNVFYFILLWIKVNMI